MRYKINRKFYRLLTQMASANHFGKKIFYATSTGSFEINLKEEYVLFSAAKNNFVLPRPVEIQDRIPRPTYWRIVQGLLKKKIISEVEE